MEEKNIKTLIDDIREQNEIERTYLKKQLNMMKALMFAMAGIFLVLLISVSVLVPKLVVTLDNANVALEQISYMAEQIVFTAEKVDEVLGSAKILVEESGEGITQALENMNSIDFEKLNQSIDDFNKVISPLSSFFGRFR
ncbi:MAG: hypothetical protein IKY94_07740 [Lachnospiraceae bacterium]|nr:hypothetical protein [Lachnospiraceae bacterium]